MTQYGGIQIYAIAKYFDRVFFSDSLLFLSCVG